MEFERQEYIEITFMRKFIPAILDGTKTWTCRTKPYGVPGQKFVVYNRLFKLDSVERIQLMEASRNWKKEGCDSEEDFIEIWKSLHPILGYDPFRIVWVHKFHKMVEEEI